MANRVISIEIGRHITRAVEIDYKTKNPKVYACFSFETPEGVLEDGLIRPDENFSNLLKGALKYFRVKTKKVVFTLNSGRIANREVQIPLVKENKITSLLMANSTEYFPVDLAQYQLVHRIIEKVDTKEDKHLKLSVLAVPNDLVKSYERFAESCNLSVAAIDYVGNSVNQIMKKMVREEISVVLKVDETASVITIMKEGKVSLQRMITYGVDEAVETMMESGAYGENLSFADAIQVMRKENCIRRHLDVELGYVEEDDVDNNIATTRANITECVRMLIGNIGRVLDYYLSRETEVEIKGIQMIGLGAECRGLSKLMTNELGIKVIPFRTFPGVKLNRIMNNPDIKITEYATCIGASFDPMNFKPTDQAAGSGEGESLAVAGFVFAVCFLASAAMIGFSLYTTITLNNQKETYNQRISELYPAKQIYEACTAAKEELDNCQKMYDMTKTPADIIPTFLREMEAKMPSEIMLTSLTVNEQGITMNVEVSSKEILSETLIQLRSLDMIGTVSCASMAQTPGDVGSASVTATITCTYAVSLNADAAVDTTE